MAADPDPEALLERLTEQGILGRPASTTRPIATSRNRVRARRSVADIVSEQRDEDADII
jgi:hypothetical protein